MDQNTRQALFSSESDEWATPDAFFSRVEQEWGPFDLDPAATPENARAPQFYTQEEDGLTKAWFGRVWVNPPYSDVRAWLCKATAEAQRPEVEHIVMLLPARTDTRWFHDLVRPYAHQVVFVRGRLKFKGGASSAPFPSMLVIFCGYPHLQLNPTVGWMTA